MYLMAGLWAGELILTSYTLVFEVSKLLEGISSSFPFIYPRKQTVQAVLSFLYPLYDA